MPRGGVEGSPDFYKVPQPEAERRVGRPTLADHPLRVGNGVARKRRLPWNLDGKVRKRSGAQ